MSTIASSGSEVVSLIFFGAFSFSGAILLFSIPIGFSILESSLLSSASFCDPLLAHGVLVSSFDVSTSSEDNFSAALDCASPLSLSLILSSMAVAPVPTPSFAAFVFDSRSNVSASFLCSRSLCFSTVSRPSSSSSIAASILLLHISEWLRAS